MCPRPPPTNALLRPCAYSPVRFTFIVVYMKKMMIPTV